MTTQGVPTGVSRAQARSWLAESALVSRLRRGDEAAYEGLVRTYGPRMLALGRAYVGSPEDAEDVLQSAFLLVFRFIDRFEGGSEFSTWLHRIVVNCALMRLRTRRRHPEERRNLAALDDDGSAGFAPHVRVSAAEVLARRETCDEVLRAVGRLPDSVRAAVRLCAVDGLSLAEASLLLGESRSAVKASLHRGRRALRRACHRPAGMGSGTNPAAR